MFNKRGLSPLIASVLLIAFTVTLFLIISSFVQRSIVEPGLQDSEEKIGDALDCLGTKIKVADACIQPLTGNPDGIRVKVDNEGDTSLTGVIIRILGSTNVQVTDPVGASASSPVGPLGRLNSGLIAVSQSGATAVGSVVSIEVIPVIASGNCANNLVTKSVTRLATCI